MLPFSLIMDARSWWPEMPRGRHMENGGAKVHHGKHNSCSVGATPIDRAVSSGRGAATTHGRP